MQELARACSFSVNLLSSSYTSQHVLKHYLALEGSITSVPQLTWCSSLQASRFLLLSTSCHQESNITPNWEKNLLLEPCSPQQWHWWLGTYSSLSQESRSVPDWLRCVESHFSADLVSWLPVPHWFPWYSWLCRGGNFSILAAFQAASL